jgi:putative flavoprotein involved in K+ transport
VNQEIETIIIGGGQAGLATSYYLSQRGCEHIVLEQAAQAGNAWRNDRWDSFALLTPNWSFRLPGAEYQGDNPDGFMARDEIVARFERYVERFRLPVHFDQRVTRIEPRPDNRGFKVSLDDNTWEALNVVIATGLYQKPKIPPCSKKISPQIVQLHSGEYRDPKALPPGAVLVVGSGQSGCQIAEELYQSGCKVYLSTGSAGRAPRRYRGKDVYEWLYLSGFLDRTVDKLPSPQAKFTANPHLSGKNGGHSLNLHQFARDGVILSGHLENASESRVWFVKDLMENLAKADKFEAEIGKSIDEFIVHTGLEAPLERLPELRDGYKMGEIDELDLNSEGIKSIIWAIGYNFSFSLVRLPVVDRDGFPLQRRGVTDYPGLFFVGLPWLNKQKSGLLVGFAEDAEFIASMISARVHQ